MQHLNVSGNLALIVGRRGRVIASDQVRYCLCHQDHCGWNVFSRGGGTVFPALLTQRTVASSLNERNFWQTFIQAAVFTLGAD